MSSKKKNFEKQFNANKVNRVTSKNSKYKKKMSKSDENYLKGDYTKSVGQTVFGVKNSIAKGEKVSGYGDDYVDTKGMNRGRYLAKQKGENPYDVQYKYTGRKKTVEGGINREGKEFDSFTTRKQRLTKEEKESFKNTGILNHPDYRPKQKYNIMGSHKGEDANKFSDHFNFGTLDGLRTAKENQRTGKHLSNAFEYGKGLLKDTVVDAGVDFIKGIGGIGSTVMAGFAGLAEDSGNAFKALADPQRDFNYYSNGRINTLENLKANQREMDKTGWGLGASTYLNEAKQRADENEIKFLEDTGRYEDAREYARKVANEKATSTKLLNATGFVMDLLAPSTVEDAVIGGIKTLGKGAKKSFDEMVKGTADISTGILPKGASDSVFFSGAKGDTGIDRKLDNDYSKRVTRDVIKQNPNTQNISKFIERIETVGGVNKTPNKTTNPFDEIVANRPKETRAKFEAKFEKLYQNYADDIDGLADRLDSMKPKNADAMYSYLQRQHPDVYNQLLRHSDEIDNVLDRTYVFDSYKTQKDIDADNMYHNTKNVRKFNTLGSDELRAMKERGRSNYKLLKDVLKPKFVDNVTNIKERESLFRNGLDALVDKIGGSSEGALEEISVNIKDLKYLINNKQIGNHELSKVLNDFVFNGKDVIRRNVKPSQANQVLDFLDEMVYRQSNGLFEEYDKAGNLVKSGEPAKLAPSLTDYRYEEKMSNLASKHGVSTKKELTSRRNELREKKKKSPLPTDEFYELQDLEKKIKEWDDEYKKVKYMYDEYDDYAKQAYRKRDINEGYETLLDELADKQAKIDATKGKENIMKEAQRNQELGSDPYARSAKGVQSTASPRAQNMLHNGDVSDWQQVTQSNVSGNIKNQIKPKDKIEYGKSIGLKYVNSKYGIQIPKDKQTFKNVYSNKNVKNAVDNLLNLMNKEVNLTQSGKYGDEYAKIRLLVEDNVKYLDKLGVDRKIYFNQLKQQKLQLIQKIQQDLQVGKNLRGGNTPIDNIANATNNINPLEMAHININGRAINNVDELTPDQLQWQYLMTQGAKTIDELFDVPDANLLQRGDNIGDEISSSLRPNSNNTPKTPDIPNNTGNPMLDAMADEVNGSTNGFKEIYRNIINSSKDELREKANQLEYTIEKLKNSGAGMEEWFDLETTLMYADRVYQAKYGFKRLYIPKAEFEFSGFKGTNPFNPIPDKDRIIYQNLEEVPSSFDNNLPVPYNKNTSTDIVPHNTPLDDISNNSNEQSNILEQIANNRPNEIPRIAPNDLALPNQLVTQDNVSNPLQQMSNRTNNFNPNIIELTDEDYRIYDELLSLGYDRETAMGLINSRKTFQAGQQDMFDILGDKHTLASDEYVHFPELLQKSNDFPVDDFDVLDYMRPNVDTDSQINMLGYITGNKLDVDNKTLLKHGKKKKQIKFPKIPDELDGGSWRMYSDYLFNVGVNPFNKPPKVKPTNMRQEVYDYWKDFSSKFKDVERYEKGLEELKRIDEHIAKNSPKEIIPKKINEVHDESLANLNIYGDSLKNSTKTIHDNIDRYTSNRSNYIKRLDDNVNIDNHFGAINDLNESAKPLDNVAKKSNTPLDNVSKIDSSVKSGEFNTSSFDNINPNNPPTFEQFKDVVNENLKNDPSKKSLKDNEIYNIYKSWLNTWKKGLTVYNPGWHIQNFFQNKGQNYLALGADAFAPQTDARQILKNIQGKPNKNIDIVDNVNNKTYTSEEISKLAQDLGVVDSVGEDVGGRSLLPKLEKKIDNSKLMKKLNESEQTARLHHFVTQIKRGMSPEEASKSVNKYLFDYGDKNKFDEFMSDFIDPFWMFHKNNTRLMATSAFEHGDKINKIVRATKGLEHGIPEGTEQNENSKYGKLQMPYANITDPINKDDYNYLYSENMMPSYEETMSLENDNFESKLNPLIRIALQQARGEGNFGNTIVEGDEADFGEVTKRDRNEEIFQDLFPFMQPLNKTVDSVKERRQKQEEGRQSKYVTDKQVFYDWLNYITGNKGNWYRNLDDM